MSEVKRPTSLDGEASTAKRMLYYQVLKNLTAVNDSSREQFLHGVIDELCSGREFVLNKFVSNDANSEKMLKELQNLKLAFCHFFQTVVATQIERKKLIDELTTLGQLPEATVNTVMSVLAQRTNEIDSLLHLQVTEQLAPVSLEDFDSSLQLVLSSDAVATMRTPVLLLHLILHKITGARETLTIELDKTSLDRMLNSFAQISQAVNRLKV